jgi:hypothetical protein
MSVDYRYLEGIRKASLDDVEATITKLLDSEGWIPGGTGGDDTRAIYLAAHGPWTVIDDPHDMAATRWAEVLAGKLGETAITLRVWSIDGSFDLQRFDAKKRVGAIAYNGDSDDEEGRTLRIATRFLADLGRGRAKATLEAGLSFDAMEGEENIARIAKLVGLPEPLERYSGDTQLEGATTLAFRYVERPRAPSSRTKAKTRAKRPSKA